jgi:hypothetical protein
MLPILNDYCDMFLKAGWTQNARIGRMYNGQCCVGK